jgi:16S rRNA (uracil1498-N3)-methyltransferase
VGRHRFFAERLDDAVELHGPEAHHLAGVLRLGAGQTVELFDGRGTVADAEIVDVRRGRVRLRVHSRRNGRQHELGASLTLVTALPKGRRLDRLLEAAVELGAAALVPLIARRSVRVPGSRGRRDRGAGGDAEADSAGDAGRPPPDALRRAFVEAAKQCGRNVLPVVGAPTTVEQLAADPPSGLRLFGLPGAPSIAARVADATAQAAPRAEPATAVRPIAAATILIGPEGGLTDDEQGRLQAAGWYAVGLAPAVLRIETAAAAALAQIGPLLSAP